MDTEADDAEEAGVSAAPERYYSQQRGFGGGDIERGGGAVELEKGGFEGPVELVAREPGGCAVREGGVPPDVAGRVRRGGRKAGLLPHALRLQAALTTFLARGYGVLYLYGRQFSRS